MTPSSTRVNVASIVVTQCAYASTCCISESLLSHVNVTRVSEFEHALPVVVIWMILGKPCDVGCECGHRETRLHMPHLPLHF